MELYKRDNEKWKRFPNLEPRDSYGFIDFTGETRAGAFWIQILANRKTQTIREPRADGRPHVIIGAETGLYWKVRSGKAKPIHKIARAKITGYECISLLDVWFDEENAVRDGFVDLDEFRLWFNPEWFELHPEIQKAAEIISLKSTGHFQTIIAGLSRRFVKNNLKEFFENIMEPVYRISWEITEKAKAVCPKCGYPQGELDLPEIELMKCSHCGHRFYPAEAKNYILPSEIE